MARLNIDKIAIVGAGPGGLAAAKYLIAEKKFSEIDIFDQRSSVGGIWKYTSNTTREDDFAIPRTQPSEVVNEAAADGVFVSPLYDLLETNIPHTLMNYCDQPFPKGTSLFPKHHVVAEYLDEYAKELKPYLKLGTQVVDVVPRGERWTVTTREVMSKKETTKIYDAIVCCSGHYSDPFIPAILGLEEFHKVHPGIVSHSKYYRRPDEFKDKRVIVVGNSASGIDISSQISAFSKGPVLVSAKIVTAPSPDAPNENKEEYPEIVEFLPDERGVQFANGRVEVGIDSVVFCTGYQYSFPFLKNLDPPAVTTGQRTENVYEHIFYYPRPTLTFLGLPQRIVPLPTSEAQAGCIARVYSGRLSLPPQEIMREWEASMVAECGSGKSFHNLAFPKDAAYINRLHDWSMMADLDPSLCNDGKGRIPPYWGPEKQWIRERFPLIKIASRKLGAKRHEVRTLEELGFDFKRWQAENERPKAETKHDKKAAVDVTAVPLSA